MRRLLPLIVLLAGCRDESVTKVRLPKEDPTGVAEAPAAAKPRGLRWTLPKGWTSRAGEGMRAATLLPPQAAGKAEVTVIALPGDVGGELANVNRWRGQIALPPIDDAALAEARTAVASKAGPVSLYDFTGASEPRTRLVAGVARSDGMSWFFKLMGDEKAVAAARPAFVKLLEGLRGEAL